MKGVAVFLPGTSYSQRPKFSGMSFEVNVPGGAHVDGYSLRIRVS